MNEMNGMNVESIKVKIKVRRSKRDENENLARSVK
jgi:hypothetical protein